MGSSSDKDLSFKELLLLLSPHPYLMKIKGSSYPCFAKYIIMTSNKHPKDWYHDVGYNKEQLTWRIHKIIKVSKVESREAVWNDAPEIALDHGMDSGDEAVCDSVLD